MSSAKPSRQRDIQLFLTNYSEVPWEIAGVGRGR